MSDTPKFTIVTPSFNQGPFVQATLDSIRDQSFTDFEHLIYDPGSTDGSVDIIQKYCADFARATFFLGQDKSQTNAINLGYRQGRGDILCWLNSDDTYFDADVLAYVARVFDENPDVDIVYGRGQFTSPDGKVLRNAYINRDAPNIQQLLSQSLGILQPSLFMRRRMFERAGALDEGMNFSFDYEYWARCAARGGKFLFVDRMLSCAVIHEDAKTMRARGVSLREALTVARRYYDFVAMDWVERMADFEVNQNDGIIKTIDTTGNEAILTRETRTLFRRENANGAALTRYFNGDPLMNDKTRQSFGALLPDILSGAYLSSWDRNYFDMGVTLIASIHRTDPDKFVFVYDLGMDADQLAFLRTLHGVIVLQKDFVPFAHDWQRHPKNYVYKIALFNHLLGLLPEECALLWVDAGVMLMQDPAPVFARLRQDGTFFIDHADFRHWPLFNASFTSDAAVLAGGFSWAELAGYHVCSAFFGCVVGHPHAAVFSEAAALAAEHDIAVGDKHPPESEKRTALPKDEQRQKAAELARAGDPVKDLHKLRSIFGYYGHRQDQSIISLLVARHGLTISSAAVFCPADDKSSTISKENWFEGVSSNLGDYAPVPEDQAGIAYHHRGLIKDFEGLRFAFDMAPVAGILGNGPSLSEVDLPALKNVDGFGMNAAYRFWEQISWYPAFYSCLDTVVGMSHKDAIRALIRDRRRLGIKAFLLRQNIVDWLAETDDLDGVINFDLIRFGVRSFLAEPITTGSHSLSWSNWIGYRQAFVTGVDCNYVEKVEGADKTEEGTLEIKAEAENPNYFFKDYQRIGDVYNTPNPSKDLHIRSWRNVAQLLAKGSQVYNISEISRMDAFEKRTLSKALEHFVQVRGAPVSRAVTLPADRPAPVATAGSSEPVSGSDPAFRMFCWTAGTPDPVVQSGAAALIPPKAGERALLVYEDPLSMIAEAIARGGDPVATLQTWETQAVAALGMLRQAHRQVSVVERARFAGAPAEAAALLAQKLPGCEVPMRFDAAADVNPLLHALAEIFLHERRSAVRALAEIRARGLRLSEEAGIRRIDATDAVTAWQRLSAYKGLAAQRQEDIDTLTARLSHLEQEVESRTRTGQLKDDQLRQLRATVTSFGGEADALRVQLAHKSAELREVKAISDRVHGEAESLMADLDALRRSTSWKLTRPVRFLRRMLSSRPSNGAGE